MASGTGTPAAALLALVLAVAYLSHTSTLAILFVATVSTAVLLRWRGGPALRPLATAIALATACAAGAAGRPLLPAFLGTHPRGARGHRPQTRAAPPPRPAA